MRFVIVTGMSGAGKSTALKILEDAGYFCVDNLPIALFSKFIELFQMSEDAPAQVALGVDIRSGQALEELQSILETMRKEKTAFEILFLDAQDDILVKRYKETRRAHPLAGEDRVDKGIAREREKLAFLKERADYILDTSQLLTRELKKELDHVFVENKSFKNLMVTILSFGFKYGIPADADLVFDVRFLPNPYYIEELKSLTGNDAPVSDYVMSFPEANEFLKKLADMIRFLIPNYIIEGKNQLVIAIGCTGGKHRSVTLANGLYQEISGEENYGVKCEHRDIEKDAYRKKL